MSTRSEVLLWAQRVIARKGQPANVLLELKADATAEQAQAAFHKIARTSHPDLHRQGLTKEEIDMVTSAYAAVAGAYQEMRTKTMATTRIKPISKDATPFAPSGGASAIDPPTSPPAMSRTMTPQPNPGASRTPTGQSPPLSRPEPARPAAHTPPSQRPVVATPPAGTASVAPSGGANAAQAMSPKALIYYRKAEIALNKGDLKGAILQLKLAIATDPASSFLRSALAEVETEVRKTL